MLFLSCEIAKYGILYSSYFVLGLGSGWRMPQTRRPMLARSILTAIVVWPMDVFEAGHWMRVRLCYVGGLLLHLVHGFGNKNKMHMSVAWTMANLMLA